MKVGLNQSVLRGLWPFSIMWSKQYFYVLNKNVLININILIRMKKMGNYPIFEDKIFYFCKKKKQVRIHILELVSF